MEPSLKRHFGVIYTTSAHFSTSEPMNAQKRMKACFNVKFAQEFDYNVYFFYKIRLFSTQKFQISFIKTKHLGTTVKISIL